MKNTKLILGIVLVVVIGAAVYLGNTATQKGAFPFPRNFDVRNLRPVESIYVTRGELMKIIIEQLMTTAGSVTGIQLVQNPTQHFSDVPPTNPYFIYIETAYARGFVNGLPNGTFRPNDNLTRAHFAVLVLHAFGLGPAIQDGILPTNGTPYISDVAYDTWYSDAVQSLYAMQVIPVNYRPGDTLERSFAREVIARMPRV